MKAETRRIVEFKREKKAEIQRVARSIGFELKRWGFELYIEDLNPYDGWAEMIPDQAYNPETYNLILNGRYLLQNLDFKELKKTHLLMKRYKHDHGVKKLRENIKEILK